MMAAAHDEQAEHLPVVSRDSERSAELVNVGEAGRDELARARRAEIVKQALTLLSSIGQLALRILSEKEASTPVVQQREQSVADVDIERSARRWEAGEETQPSGRRRRRRWRGSRQV